MEVKRRRKRDRPRRMWIDYIKEDLTEKERKELDVKGIEVNGDGMARTATPCERWDKMH